MANKYQCKRCLDCETSTDLCNGDLHIWCAYLNRPVTENGIGCNHFRQNEYDNRCWDGKGHFKRDFLWKLRQEITLNSLYLDDYENSFGIAPQAVCDFFEGYTDYLYDLVEERYGANCVFSELMEDFDNEGNLIIWASHFTNPIFTKGQVI